MNTSVSAVRFVMLQRCCLAFRHQCIYPDGSHEFTMRSNKRTYFRAVFSQEYKPMCSRL